MESCQCPECGMEHGVDGTTTYCPPCYRQQMKALKTEMTETYAKKARERLLLIQQELTEP